MRLWRISRFPDLGGTGGILASGRWHTMPKAVLYCADHPASALLEVFVHLGVDPEDVPEGYRLLTIAVPDDVASTHVSGADLDQGWRSAQEATRRIGDAWFGAGATALLDAPSAIVPKGRIVVVNTRHADAARLSIVDDEPVAFDPRLWKASAQR